MIRSHPRPNGYKEYPAFTGQTSRSWSGGSTLPTVSVARDPGPQTLGPSVTVTAAPSAAQS